MKAETTKAILVIDMPNSCDECQFSWNTDEEWKLSCQLEHDLGTRKGNKPEWCPLKPLPKRKNEYTDIDAIGWNALLKLIKDERGSNE